MLLVVGLVDYGSALLLLMRMLCLLIWRSCADALTCWSGVVVLLLMLTLLLILIIVISGLLEADSRGDWQYILYPNLQGSQSDPGCSPALRYQVVQRLKWIAGKGDHPVFIPSRDECSSRARTLVCGDVRSHSQLPELCQTIVLSMSIMLAATSFIY